METLNISGMSSDYLVPGYDYYRHRTVEEKYEAIMSSGVTVKNGKTSTYTIEHANTPQELLNAKGYLEASAKGEGKTVDLYFQIPEYFINMPNFTFDTLRLNKEDYEMLIETILFPSVLTDPAYLECKENINFVNEEGYLKEVYLESKQKLSPISLAAINAIEPMYIIKKKETVEEKESGFKPNSFVPDFSIPTFDSPSSSIIPSIFIKYIFEDGEVLTNASYFENLEEKTKNSVINFIESKCNKELEI